MEAEARYTWVGAAVLGLLAALVAALMWLKDVGSRGDFNRYAIHFERQALDGLQLGAEVNLRGIKVGRVEDYALSNDKLNRVRVEIRLDPRTPVRTNTVAVVTRNIVTGIAAINLVTREPAGTALIDIPDGERLPVIAEGRSDIDELTGRVTQVGEQAASVLAQINQLLAPENTRLVLDTVRNLRDLTAGLNRRLTAVDSVLASARQAAVSIDASAEKLGQAGDRVAAVAERSGERLDGALVQAEQALSEARSALARASSSLDSIDRQVAASSRRLEQTAEHMDDQLGAALTELRSGVETATRTLDRLRDPRASLLGPGRAQLGPGETKP